MIERNFDRILPKYNIYGKGFDHCILQSKCAKVITKDGISVLRDQKKNISSSFLMLVTTITFETFIV